MSISGELGQGGDAAPLADWIEVAGFGEAHRLMARVVAGAPVADWSEFVLETPGETISLGCESLRAVKRMLTAHEPTRTISGEVKVAWANFSPHASLIVLQQPSGELILKYLDSAGNLVWSGTITGLTIPT